MSSMTDRQSAASILAAAVLTVTAAPSLAQSPAALVEDVDAPKAGVVFMDYLVAGRVIDLGANGRLKLGYLKSCLSETITGGKVTVGREKSKIHGGKIKRERVECDGGRLELTAEEAGKSAVLVLRAPPGGRKSALARPSFKIYGASPFFRVADGADRVIIERIDRPGADVEIALKGGRADFAAQNRALKPGGIYRAKSGTRSVVFDVDPLAMPGPGPIIGRLVEF